MLSIRLSRVGKKHQPSYRLIVLDKRKDPWGDCLENLGFYNPMVKPKKITLKEERIKYWIAQGAQPTDTVWNILISQKVLDGKKHKKHSTSKKDKTQKIETKEQKSDIKNTADAKEKSA